MKTFQVVTYWWGRDKINENTSYDYFRKEKQKKKSYMELIENLKKKCDILKIPFYAEYHPEFEKKNRYQTGISYKPQFIKKMLGNFKCPVVYIDADMMFHKYPKLFSEIEVDFMAFNWYAEKRLGTNMPIDWNTLDTSGGIFYFNNSKNSKIILNKWISCMKSKELCKYADDRVLSIIINSNNLMKKCSYYWLPYEYFYIPEYYSKYCKNKNKIVISHPYKLTDEEVAYKNGSNKNRIPQQFNKYVIKRAKQMNSYTFSKKSIFMRDLRKLHLDRLYCSESKNNLDNICFSNR